MIGGQICMVYARCIRKCIDNSVNDQIYRNITGFELRDKNGNTIVVEPNKLENLIRNNRIIVVNLDLNNEGIVEESDYIKHISDAKPELKCIDVINGINGRIEQYVLKDRYGNTTKLNTEQVIDTILLKQINIENLRYCGNIILDISKPVEYNVRQYEILALVLGFVYKGNKICKVIIDDASKPSWGGGEILHHLKEMDYKEYLKYLEHDRFKNIRYNGELVDNCRKISKISYEEYKDADLGLDLTIPKFAQSKLSIYSYKLKNFDAKDSYEPLKIQDFLSTDANNVDNDLISTKKLLLFTKTDYTVLIDDNKPIATISNFKIDTDIQYCIGQLDEAIGIVLNKSKKAAIKAKACGIELDKCIRIPDVTVKSIFGKNYDIVESKNRNRIELHLDGKKYITMYESANNDTTLSFDGIYWNQKSMRIEFIIKAEWKLTGQSSYKHNVEIPIIIVNKPQK